MLNSTFIMVTVPHSQAIARKKKPGSLLACRAITGESGSIRRPLLSPLITCWCPAVCSKSNCAENLVGLCTHSSQLHTVCATFTPKVQLENSAPFWPRCQKIFFSIVHLSEARRAANPPGNFNDTEPGRGCPGPTFRRAAVPGAAGLTQSVEFERKIGSF